MTQNPSTSSTNTSYKKRDPVPKSEVIPVCKVEGCGKPAEMTGEKRGYRKMCAAHRSRRDRPAPKGKDGKLRDEIRDELGRISEVSIAKLEELLRAPRFAMQDAKCPHCQESITVRCDTPARGDRTLVQAIETNLKYLVPKPQEIDIQHTITHVYGPDTRRITEGEFEVVDERSEARSNG